MALRAVVFDYGMVLTGQPNAAAHEEMLRITERISTALARPYRIDGRTLSVLASVGGVFADNPDTDPSKLLSRADDAMYGVKWSRRRQRRSMTE